MNFVFNALTIAYPNSQSPPISRTTRRVKHNKAHPYPRIPLTHARRHVNVLVRQKKVYLRGEAEFPEAAITFAGCLIRGGKCAAGRGLGEGRVFICFFGGGVRRDETRRDETECESR
jgi:hypothetical protein